MWLTNPETLVKQVGMSLRARWAQFILRFDRDIKYGQFRRIYRQAHITKQKLSSRLGGEQLEHPETQAQRIRNL